MTRASFLVGTLAYWWFGIASVTAADSTAFLTRHCAECHSGEEPAASLDLVGLSNELSDPELVRRWVKVHDRVAEGEMPPPDAPQPTAEERAVFVAELATNLIASEQAHSRDPATRRLRRLTRSEYEHTIRDLFEMPGIALATDLPADGSAHGFDRHADALDISHVNLARYLEAADHVLNYAIATRPEPPLVQQRRISLANRGGFVAHVLTNGDGVLLRDGQPDPEFPPAAEQNHLDEGAHERWGSFERGSSVGLFRHEDESFSPYFIEHVTIYPGRYRVRTSLWSFQWDKGTMLPGRGTEAARLSVVQLTGDGRGGQHPSTVLGYFDAPAEEPQEHEVNVWLNHNELIGFNTASLAPTANYSRPGRAMAFTGPGIVCDWLEIEGPLHPVWPPRSHSLLFGNLPLAEFRAEDHPGITPPPRPQVRQLSGQNRRDNEPGLWTVRSDVPLEDANRLLAEFLPRLFRRPVSDDVRLAYVGIVAERLATGDSFESAMRAACKTALCAPDFLFHVEPDGPLDGYAFACRLSYLLWNSLPDERLTALAAAGELSRPEVLHAEVERLLDDPKSQRFVNDFVGQWLKLNQIAATDPDRTLYPEFSPYLQDAMVAETRAYFRELVDRDLDATHVARSDFVMLNQKLATHYGIDGVSGTEVRPVPLPEGCPRGGLLTQASILKITANGTTTSPVPRGAFVLDRILGEPPEPPPANVAAIEPDVRGTTTIRDQLAKHREHDACASCHKHIDPPGFALESFDVIGGYRARYRSIGEGDPAERGVIDPFIGIGFRLGPAVDSTGTTPEGVSFASIREYQDLLARDSDRLLQSLARQLVVYATGREVTFGRRAQVAEIVRRTRESGGGVRTLIHEVVGSPLFTGAASTLEYERGTDAVGGHIASGSHGRMLMMSTLAAVDPLRRTVPVDAQPTTPAEVSDEHRVRLRITGLFERKRIDDLHAALQQFPEVRLQQFDFETSEAEFCYAPAAGLFAGANEAQLIERIHNRLSECSRHTIGAKSLCPIPREQLTRVEFPIVGLDCQACSLAVYDMLSNSDGVEQATASFPEKLAVAWIDPSRTSPEKLRETLVQRGVTLADNP
jgi:mono/diheme cytochrome c family protein/copper chaperone CopZ